MEYPKSNSRLRFGDFCFVRRDDARFAIFVYLEPVPRSRIGFYGAFLRLLLDVADVSKLPETTELGPPAMTVIKCYRENGLHVIGNIADRISVTSRAAAHAVISNENVGAVSIVWGYLTILENANEVPA